MTVNTILRRAAASLSLLALTAFGVAGCAKLKPLTAPGPNRGSADFGIYVAMGGNLTAGFQSGGLAQRHQQLSYANLFATQVGTPRFTIPAVNLGGWPPLLRVRSFGPPLLLDSVGQRGAFINPLTNPPALLDSAYHNMAIPGALLADVMDSTLNYSLAPGRDVSFFFNIARQQGRPLPLSILQLVANKKPTFLSFEYGVNELLGPAVRGSGTPAVPGAVWGFLLNSTLTSLDARIPNAKKLIVNVPDVTLFPFFHALPPVELTAAGTPVIQSGAPKFLIGPGGQQLVPGDLVTLRAADSLALGVGYAIGDVSYLSGTPVPGNGRPLLDSQVLSFSEQVSLRNARDAYNAAIASQASARGYALLDANRLYSDLYFSGYHFAGVDYTAAYLTGGLFSVDGLHPTDFVHGLLCNQMGNAVLEKFGARIPILDLARLRTPSSSGMTPIRSGASPMPLAASIPLARLGVPTGNP